MKRVLLSFAALGVLVDAAALARDERPLWSIGLAPEGPGPACFSPGGEILAQGTSSGIRIIDAATGRTIRSIAVPESVVVSTSPDGRQLVTRGRGAVAVIDVASGTVERRLTGIPGPVTSMALSPNGEVLAVGGYQGSLTLWNVRDDAPITKLSTDGQWCWSVAYSPDGRFLAGGGKPDVFLWDVASGRRLHVVKTYPDERRGHANIDTFAICFTASGHKLVTGGQDEAVRVWSVDSGKIIAQFKEQRDVITSLACDPSGGVIVSGGYTDVVAYDETAGTVLRTWSMPALVSGRGDLLPIQALAFAPGGDAFVIGAPDGTVTLWRSPRRRHAPSSREMRHGQ